MIIWKDVDIDEVCPCSCFSHLVSDALPVDHLTGA